MGNMDLFLGVPVRMTQLITVLEEWTSLLQHNMDVGVIYLDFRKAFDSVPHHRLINKLEAYGIRGVIQCWITNFITGRKQRVALGGTISDWTPVLIGIPQGSVLGPTLFIGYINDLPSIVTCTCKLFVDDTKIYRQVSIQKTAEYYSRI